MQTIIVASRNPVKIQAAQEGFAQLFRDETFEIQGLSDFPD